MIQFTADSIAPISGRKSEAHADAELVHEVLTDFEAGAAIRQEWDDFVVRTGGDLYATFDWCRIWWKHYGTDRKLHIHLFRRAHELVAILPLFSERLRLGPVGLDCVRIVGCDHSVTTCSIAIADDCDRIMQALVHALNRRQPWDVIHFGPLAGYVEWVERVAGALQSAPGVQTVNLSNDGPQILIDLPENFEAYLTGLRRAERNNIRRRERNLYEKFAAQVRVAVDADFDEQFTLFIRQHQEQWQNEGQLGHFVDWPGAEAYHREMARAQLDKGRLNLLWIETNQGTIGYQYNYIFNGRLYWILGSRAPNRQWDSLSPGQRLHCATVNLAVSAGLRQIDAMRGMYDYKLWLGGRVVQLRSMTAVATRRGSAFRWTLFRRLSRLRHLIYYRIWHGRLAAYIPALRRPLWIGWIRSRL